MNRLFRRLPLPVKLMLIGLVPFLFLVYLSFTIYSDRSQTVTILGSYIERVRESSLIGQLIEELQKERRYSFIYSTTGQMPPELIAQRKVTDSIIQSVKNIEHTDLENFTSYTFLKDLDKTRRMIDTVPAMGGEFGMSYYTNTIFRLNTLNVFPIESGRRHEEVHADIETQKAVSQMAAYLGIIRSNVYNVLFTRQNAQNTLFGLRGIYDIYKSYETELLTKANISTGNNYRQKMNTGVIRQVSDYVDSLFVTYAFDSTYDAEEWWIASGQWLEALFRIKHEYQAKVDFELSNLYKKEINKRNQTLIFLVISMVIITIIVVYVIRSISQMLNELKFSAKALARGSSIEKPPIISNDVMGDLALSITEIDKNHRQLAYSAEAIGRGDFSIPIKPRSEDDVLGHSVVRMKNNLEQFRRTIEESSVQLQDLAEKYKTIFYKSPLPKIIYDETTKQLLEVNDAALRQYGYTQEEFLSLTLADLEVPHKKSKDAPIKTANGHVVRHHRKKNGQPIIVELTSHAIDYNDRLAKLAVINDITDRRRSEEAMRNSELTRRLIMNAALDAIVCIDTNGSIIVWNPQAEKTFGWEESEALGTQLTETIIPEQYRQRHDEGMKKYLRTGEGPVLNKVIEMSALHRNGREFPIELSILPIRQGSYLFFCAFIRDITLRKKAEENIRSLAYRNLQILNTMQDGFVLTDTHRNIVDVNPAYCLMVGYSKEELLRMKIDRLEGWISMEKLEERLEELKSIGNIKFEGQNRTKDGRIIDIEISTSIMEMDGKTMIAGFVRDITLAKKAQEELSGERNLLRSLIDNLPDYIYVKDINSRYIINNKAFVNLVGSRTENETVGKRVTDLFTQEIWEINEKEDRRVIEKGEEIIDRDEPITTNNGLHLWLLTTKIPLKDKEGNVIGILGISKDITERKRAEEALKHSEHKYRLLFEDNPMPLWMFSLDDLRFIDVNEAAVNHYGYSKEEFLNMSINDIRPSEDIAKVRASMNDKSPGVRNSGIWRHRKKDGRLINVEIISHDIEYEEEPVRLVLAIDVTEKLKSEEALKQSYDDLRELASHLENIREEERIHIAREIHDELGQQLTVLKMDISWLNKRFAEGEDVVKSKIQGLLQLLDVTVKTVRRISSELRPSMLDDLGLVAALEWQSQEFQNRSGIKSDFLAILPELEIDKRISTGLFRIYQESLTNVARHSEATEVMATLKYENDNLVMIIIDNGKGFITSGIENKKTLGILGMKERAIMMGGEYVIESTPGRGTSILVKVPVSKGN